MSLQLCCLSQQCRRVLQSDDDLSEHVHHKLYTCQQVRKAFEKQQLGLINEVKFNRMLEHIDQQSDDYQHLCQDFITKLIDEIEQFRAQVIKTTTQLIKQLGDIKFKQYNQEYSHNLEQVIIKQQYTIDNLVKLVDTCNGLTEKQLKDGLNDCQTHHETISVNYAEQLHLTQPYDHLTQAAEFNQQNKSAIEFIRQSYGLMRDEHTQRTRQWSQQVECLLGGRSMMRGFNLVCQKQVNIPKIAILKTTAVKLFKDDLLMICGSNQFTVYNLSSLKQYTNQQFKQVITDYDVDTIKGIVAIVVGQILCLYQIQKFKLLRRIKISIDLSKHVCIRFLENQVCISSGLALEFFPVYPCKTLQSFSQTLNFHSYYDRIHLVDYAVVNRFGNSDMALLIGTISGQVSLYNSSFTELYSKQLHQECVMQFRFKQSNQHGKLLLTIGADMRINICTLELNLLKIIRTVNFTQPIQEILIFPTYSYVLTNSNNSLEAFLLTDQEEIIKQPINISKDIRIDLKDNILNLGHNVIILKGLLYLSRLL